MSPKSLTSLKSLLSPAKDVLLFLALLFGFHFIYLGWSKGLEFWPLEPQVLWLFEWVAGGLLKQSVWIMQALGMEIVLVDQTIYANHYEAFVSVVPECTTLKQWLHWLVIMAFFPGPWKHKIWYIPLGIVAIHLTNLFRVLGLTLIQFPFPGKFHFFHDYIFKTLFYAVIFGMWLLWNEKARRK